MRRRLQNAEVQKGGELTVADNVPAPPKNTPTRQPPPPSTDLRRSGTPQSAAINRRPGALPPSSPRASPPKLPSSSPFSHLAVSSSRGWRRHGRQFRSSIH